MTKPHYRLKLDGSYEIIDESKPETKTEIILADDVVDDSQHDLLVGANNNIELLSEDDNRQYHDRTPARLYIESLNSPKSQKTMGNIICMFVLIWNEFELYHHEQLKRESIQPLFDVDISILSDQELVLLAPWRRLTNWVLTNVLKHYEVNYQVSASRLNSMLVAIRQVAKKGKSARVIDPIKADLILENKVSRKANKTGGRIEAVTIEETQAVIDSILAIKLVTNRALCDATIFAFLFGTGVRVSELLEMDMENIDFNSMEVQVVGKGDKLRTVDIPSDAFTLLNYIKKFSQITTGPVFRRISPSDNIARTKDTGGDKQHKDVRLTPQAVNNFIKGRYEVHPELAIYKKKTSVHDFRRGLITHLAKEGYNALLIAELVGHDDVNSTMRYIKETEEARREMVQGVKFDIAID